jgi:hypothetical protein
VGFQNREDRLKVDLSSSPEPWVSRKLTAKDLASRTPIIQTELPNAKRRPSGLRYEFRLPDKGMRSTHEISKQVILPFSGSRLIETACHVFVSYFTM